MTALASTLSALASLGPGAPLHPTDVLEDKFGQIRSLPTFGTWALYSVIVLAGITFAISLAAARRPRLLTAARNAAYATCALVVFDLLILAYAFVTHDFRIRYVARYSDRSMSTGYLLTALWGGQDGSLLWWIFLLSLNTAACVAWMRSKWRDLQPYVIATLMTVIAFFAIIMAFSANPFSETISGARVDGEGLNPLLQNFYMIIHPPSLYTGFVGCAVPFAFGIAALASGRLDEEWLVAVRKWMLFAWLFLSIGNVLGMLWAYEELGWGGFWAWDPVENAAFMPWLTASAYVHSTMIQERRRMLKIWNVALICQTFFMTIWGTFLTRSGMIKSVHAFAQSSIGIYFTYFMVTIATVAAALVVLRLPELKNLEVDAAATRVYRERVAKVVVGALLVVLGLCVFVRLTTTKMWPLGIIAFAAVQFLGGYGMARMRRTFAGFPWGDYVPSIVLVVLFGPLVLVGCVTYWVVCATVRDVAVTDDARRKHQAVAANIDTVLSREAAFVANNWILLAMQIFIALTTAFPLISTMVTGEEVTVGPKFYNTWMIPFGLALFALMGIGPLLGWRKSSDAALRRAFRVPLAAMAVAGVLHLVIGKYVRFPAVVPVEPIYGGALGKVLAKLQSVFPLFASTLAAFNAAVIAQEFHRGVGARRATQRESLFAALKNLVAKNRRRYGGYIVHTGIVVMFLGVAGSAYKTDRELALRPGESAQFEGYTLTYLGPRRVDTDPAKMEIYADIALKKNGKDLGVLHPARFVYRRQQMPTSEVAIHTGPREDVYIAPGSVNPETKLATIHVYVNPLTSWIWFGALILILGAAVALWPDPREEEAPVTAYLRVGGAVASSLVLGLIVALTPARIYAQTGGGSSLHAGDVQLKSPEEKRLFSNLLCMCGDCERLPLSTCACGWADEMRQKLGARLAAGESVEALTDWYAKEHGQVALNVPRSKSVWIVPAGIVVLGGVGAVLLVRSWTRRRTATTTASGASSKEPAPTDEYDAKLQAELDDLER